MAKKFAKTLVGIGAAAVAGKVAYDKYKTVKEAFTKEENESVDAEVKKYNAIFEKKVVEVEDEEFSGCEIKTVGAKAVLDLGLAVFEKDVYINFNSTASTLTIILPEGVNVACDIEKSVSSVKNLVDNVDEEGIHTVYVIGKAVGSSIEIIPVNFYMDDDDDFEDTDEDIFVDEDKQEAAAEKEALQPSEDGEADGGGGHDGAAHQNADAVGNLREHDAAGEAADHTGHEVDHGGGGGDFGEGVAGVLGEDTRRLGVDADVHAHVGHDAEEAEQHDAVGEQELEAAADGGGAGVGGGFVDLVDGEQHVADDADDQIDHEQYPPHAELGGAPDGDVRGEQRGEGLDELAERQGGGELVALDEHGEQRVQRHLHQGVADTEEGEGDDDEHQTCGAG